MSEFIKDTRTVKRTVRTGVEISLEELLEAMDQLDLYVEDDDGNGEDVTIRYNNDFGFVTHDADDFTVTVPSGRGRKTVSLSDVMIRIEFADGNGPDDDEDDC